MPDPAILRYDGGLPVYRYGRAPGELATARQLREQRLSPAGLKPAGWLYYNRMHHLTCALYDRATARPIRPLTDRQRQALAAGRAIANTVQCRRCTQVRVSAWGSHLCKVCAPVVQAEHIAEWQRQQREAEEALAEQIAGDHAAAARWAAEILTDPRSLVLDLETTGLGEDYIVEIAITDMAGNSVMNTLVNPGIPIPDDARAIHGISDDDVKDAPSFAGIWPELCRVIDGCRLIIYNSDYDTTILFYEADRYFKAVNPDAITGPCERHPDATEWWESIARRAECAMHMYARWFGDWSDYWGDYTWQPLNGGHRAASDCQATIARLETMAADAAVQAVASTLVGGTGDD